MGSILTSRTFSSGMDCSVMSGRLEDLRREDREDLREELEEPESSLEETAVPESLFEWS
jgi:hypothetical protein